MTENVIAIDWEHSNPVHIISGVGALTCLSDLVSEGKTLLVTTAGFTRRGITARIVAQLGTMNISICDVVTPNPELDFLESITKELRNSGVTSIVAIGGGSVMDVGKILGVTLLSDSKHPLSDVFRHGHAENWERRIPVIAIPTTSGTGAEVTPFATVWDEKSHKKHSVSGNNIYPVYALLDPSLTITLPYQETLYTGLDAISQALESLWNRNRTPVSEAFALRSLQLAVKALPLVLTNPENLEQRSYMQYASLLAGLAISQTRTAIAHSISYPLTSSYGVPHGLACSFTLASILSLIRKKEPLFISNYEPIISEIVSFLATCNLRKEIMLFVDMDDIKVKIPEMVTKERSDNFMFSVNTPILTRILENA